MTEIKSLWPPNQLHFDSSKAAYFVQQIQKRDCHLLSFQYDL